MNAQRQASAEPIRVGIVGLGGMAAGSLDTIARTKDLKVVSVADLNKEAVESAAARFSARGYTDVRSLIVESDIQAVIMSLPHHVYPEFVRLAADRGLHLLKEKPLARSLEEGLALHDAYQRGGRVFMLQTQRRFHPGFVQLKARLAEAGRPFLVRSRFLFNWGGDFRWRGEKSKAGFGCLGDAGYHNFDLLQWLFGPPQQVYSLQGGIGRANPARPYDTDDTGVVVLGYEGGMVGQITASWATAGESTLDVIVHGTEATLEATPALFSRRTGKEGADERVRVAPARMAKRTREDLLAAFVAAVRASADGAKTDYPCSSRENLLTLAAVEAAYLSARTGSPQSPARMFEVHGRRIEDFRFVARPAAGAAPPRPGQGGQG
ncbi:MAG: Inositol 2-dehydrogenase/D-chiro-inositol 3-dehydrogenase [Phycisphaerae bacterium]|nr:Inositol 2-dehydrogenase/D-chiro-inositol 3-dehydrogenase [Phycisphaerae bacterium]